MAIEPEALPTGPVPDIVKSEKLTALDSGKAKSLTFRVFCTLGKMDDTSLKTPEMDIQEAQYLKDRLSQEKSGLFGIGGKKLNLKDQDKLWVALNIIYPKEAANIAYSIIRTAQIKALGGNVPEGWNSEKVHRELLKNPDHLNNFNQRQILFGEGAALSLLNRAIKAEEHRNENIQVKPLPDETKKAESKPVEPGGYIWNAEEGDFPVKVVKSLGIGPDGREYVLVEGSNTGIPRDQLISQDKEVVAEKERLITVWQDSSREPVELSKIPLGEKSGERMQGGNFTGFVLPTNEAEMVCEDRAGFLEFEDGTKVFLGADGLSGSYMGSLAAQEIIDIMREGLSAEGLPVVKGIFADPKGFIVGLGEQMKAAQTRILDHYKANFQDNPEESEVHKDVEKEKAEKYGSGTTFFMVAVFPTGEVRYINVGDGMIQKLTEDGIEDLLQTQPGRVPKNFSTAAGAPDDFKAGTVSLKQGEVLLFGTDGVKHNLEGLQKAFSDKTYWPNNISQVGDDLTVFAYYQEGQQVLVQAAELETTETPAATEADAVQEIKTYKDSWENHFPKDRILRIGSSADADVYLAIDPSTGVEVVVKVYKEGKGNTYVGELDALTALRDLDCVPRIIGHGEPGNQFIVKEFIKGKAIDTEISDNGSGMLPVGLPVKPVKPGEYNYEGYKQELKETIDWTISSLEDLAKIHQRGFLVNDFKFSDFLLGEDGKVTIIDLGNAVREGSKGANASKMKDIQSILRQFFFAAGVGQEVMSFFIGSHNWLSSSLEGGPATLEEIKVLKRDGENKGAVPAFMHIIDLMEKGNNSAQEYVDVLKDYFQEVGLYGEGPGQEAAQPHL